MRFISGGCLENHPPTKRRHPSFVEGKLFVTRWFSTLATRNPRRNEVHANSPPYEGGVAAASADGVVLYVTQKSFSTTETSYDLRRGSYVTRSFSSPSQKSSVSYPEQIPVRQRPTSFRISGQGSRNSREIACAHNRKRQPRH